MRHFLDVFQSSFEFALRLAEVLGQLGQLRPAEQNQHYQANQDQLRRSDVDGLNTIDDTGR